jgi:hypothetical protein
MPVSVISLPAPPVHAAGLPEAIPECQSPTDAPEPIVSSDLAPEKSSARDGLTSLLVPPDRPVGLPEVPGVSEGLSFTEATEPIVPSHRAAEPTGACKGFTSLPAPADHALGLPEAATVPQRQTPSAASELIVSPLETRVPPTQEKSSQDEVFQQPIERASEAGSEAHAVLPTAAVPDSPAAEEVGGTAADIPIDEVIVPTSLAYTPRRPPPTKIKPTKGREKSPRLGSNAEAPLRLRVQLVFGRGGNVESLALVPDRREGMPCEVRVAGAEGERHLSELRDDCYERILLNDPGGTLFRGAQWCGRGDASRWRWVLGGRSLYVFAPGDQVGLRGFVSTARLSLHAPHVVLARAEQRDEVLAALAEAGCAKLEANDETMPGVPHGWLLFRDVIPTQAVPMRDECDILNALCPLHEVEPHFVGGIRLERLTWLAGFPPRIRFTGDVEPGFRVMIDDHPAPRAHDDAFEAPNWDAPREHCLWFGDKTVTYALRPMDEQWDCWQAHDFGTGAAICGARNLRATPRHCDLRDPAPYAAACTSIQSPRAFSPATGHLPPATPPRTGGRALFWFATVI